MEKSSHVLILPFPAQGHIKPLLCLAELLCHAGLHVTFVNTHHNHRRLINLQDLSALYPALHFESISDGLPDDHPRSGLQDMGKLIWSIQNVTKSLFRDLLRKSVEPNSERPPVTCVITDGIMSFAIDAAEEIQVKVMAFRPYSAGAIWAYLCLSKLIEAGEIPFSDKDLDKPITCIPGMERFLRRRDLPTLCRCEEVDYPMLQFFLREAQSMTRASALIMNTFDGLEGPIISEIASLFPKIYTIGPLHALLRPLIKESPPLSSSSGILWKDNRDCISWLDYQPRKSVIFVSFGSLVQLTPEQILEFWHGLMNSNVGFLWVFRSNSIKGEDNPGRILQELEDKTGNRGRICSWAPQEEVLAHIAIGGSLYHGGWNSTLECIYEGLPVISWPKVADQQTNSRYVSGVWKIGLELKDTCDRSTVEKMVKDLMVNKREVIMKPMDKISKMANGSVKEGGSSYSNLMKLIEDINSLNHP